jgi:hypothetical protein
MALKRHIDRATRALRSDQAARLGVVNGASYPTLRGGARRCETQLIREFLEDLEARDAG